MFDGRWIPGFKNLRTTSFINYTNSTSLEYRDPLLGAYQGSLEFYNYLQGLKRNGTPIINPINDQVTKFMTNGDPVMMTGWFEWIGWPGGPSPGDRRYVISCGPINMAPGDIQELVVAMMIRANNDNIHSIYVLKELAVTAEQYYRTQLIVSGGINEGVVPVDYSLLQNYPNPFNSSTVINFSIPAKSLVNLTVYDITGQRVASLLNNEMSPGTHTVNFSNHSLPSGVYFYRLTVDGRMFVRKMMMLK